MFGRRPDSGIPRREAAGTPEKARSPRRIDAAPLPAARMNSRRLILATSFLMERYIPEPGSFVKLLQQGVRGSSATGPAYLIKNRKFLSPQAWNHPPD
jgi:hypothetical protein